MGDTIEDVIERVLLAQRFADDDGVELAAHLIRERGVAWASAEADAYERAAHLAMRNCCAAASAFRVALKTR